MSPAEIHCLLTWNAINRRRTSFLHLILNQNITIASTHMLRLRFIITIILEIGVTPCGRFDASGVEEVQRSDGDVSSRRLSSTRMSPYRGPFTSAWRAIAGSSNYKMLLFSDRERFASAPLLQLLAEFSI